MQNPSMENPYELLNPEERDAEQFSRPSISYWQDAWRRLKKDKLAMFGMVFIAIVALFCPYEYDTSDLPPFPSRPAPSTGSAPTPWAAICMCASSTARASACPSAWWPRR